MPVVLMLNGIGFVMIYRLNASSQSAADAPWRYQAVWTVLGVAAYVVTLAVVRRSRDLERYRYLLVFGASRSPRAAARARTSGTRPNIG